MRPLDCRFRKRLPEFQLDVALTVDTETLALVGRSGSGKSTTLNVIAGLARPDEGAIALASRPLLDVAGRLDVAPEARRIGYLFQHYALFPHLSVYDNVAFGLFREKRAQRQERVRKTLDLLGLMHVDRAHPWELSGGEQQRVALARALVTEPDALLLDEPLAALDVESRSRIRLELRDLLARLDIPAIVVSHDFDDARVLGDRIAVMNRGRVVQTGSASAIAAYPADDFVAALTSTNLAIVARNGAAGERVAFDPWSATLSANARGGALEWRGEIVDVRPLGAQVRVALRGSANLRVDVSAAEAAREGFEIGRVVFASVPEHAIRHAPLREDPDRP